MAQPSMSVRIAANLSELRKNMAEGRDQIEATRAGFQKLATSFQGDKIIQQANNVAAAVQAVGGASKLTEAEQARVNRTVEAALAKYQALGKEAPSALRQLADETRRVGTESSAMGSKLNSVVTGAVAGLSAALTNLAANALRSAISGIGDFITRGGQVAGMRASFNALSGGVEQADSRIGAIRKSTMGLVDDMAIMQASNKATLLGLGLNDQKMGDLAKTATILSRAMGQDATKSLDDLITALGRSSPMILDNLGLSVKVGEANEAYAKALGKTSAALTDAEKKQAFMNSAMDAAAEKVQTLGGLQLTASDRISQMWTSVKNVTDASASWFVQLGFVNRALETMQVNMGTLEGLFRGGPKAALDAYKQATGDFIPKVAELGTATHVTSQAAGALTMSQEDYLKISDALTVSVTKHAEATTALGSAKAALAPEVDRFTGLESRSLQETAKLTIALEKWAQTNGAVLMPSIRQVSAALSEQNVLVSTATPQWTGFAGTVQQNTAAAGESTGGFMDRLRGLFGGGGSGGGSTMGQVLNAVGPQFAAAFMGPGSAGDKMKAFATQAAGTLMGMIPGVGPWLQAFSGPIVEGLTKLASKAKDILSGIFGGPSATEKQQRSLVAEFEKDLAAGLTATQKLEAGGESWKETVIAVRDAYIAQGRSAEEAEADVKRLWESSKQGAGATAAVMAEIKRKMDEAAAAGEEMADRVTTAVNGIPRNVDIAINGKYRQDDLAPEGFASGSGGLRDFGRGTLAVLHGRERVQTEAQMREEQSGSGAGVTVHVDARGALLNDYQGQEKLADIVSAAVLTRLGMKQTVGVAGAF